MWDLNSITRTIVWAVLLLWGPVYAADAVKEEAYHVGVGDLLDIKVLGESDFSGNFRVSTDGSIDYPHLRKIEVKGKTREELAGQLTKLLRDGYLSDPQVSVDVKEYLSQKVMVVGAVKNAGTFILQQETHILDILSKAGGISQEGGKRVLLLRKSGEPENKPIIIDYYRLVHEGDMSQNVTLADGDIVNVPKADEIFVYGNVARPGPVKYEDNISILQAVTTAGGPTPTASTKSTYILRQEDGVEKKLNVRLDRILENKEKNVPLRRNDVVVVPESFF